MGYLHPLRIKSLCFTYRQKCNIGMIVISKHLNYVAID
jgi:hypothetical protein